MGTIVFAPGGDTGSDVYTDWIEFCAAAANTRGGAVLKFDFNNVSGGVYSPPAGNFDIGRGSTWEGVTTLSSGTQAQITFSNGTTFEPWSTPKVFDNILLHGAQAAVPFQMNGTYNQNFISVYRGCYFETTGTALFQVDRAFAEFWLHDDAWIGEATTGSHPVIQTTAFASSSVIVHLCDQANIDAGALLVGAGSHITPAIDSPAVALDASYRTTCALRRGCAFSSTGSPEGAVNASPGCTYVNYTDGSFWIKGTAGGNGNTGWVKVSP
jgi:hypothetical protein